MIKSYADYQRYLEADRIALGRQKSLKALLMDDIWAFQRSLRLMEYVINCRKNFLIRQWAKYRLRKFGTRLGFSIPPNTFGPGLSIAHMGTIVVNHGARIGANCRLHVCVNIGTEAGFSDRAPKLGDNCYIGPGAKLFGAITLGDNTKIGANAVVNKSFPAGNTTLVGIPAKPLPAKQAEEAAA